ncbi:enamine deaminase RidA (YjgF/YER057c/UK114 family) [Sinorhizobium terangae]|uniref:RidA family protein n=1 Tax=Sinorhizobium terangae TaxID=110322 RepID=A0A6N7LJF6_SINTE|nr:RidA family protein [Sinorhizobium terangae]MBB4189682.1 enamine deaminase RidA (YjgF/YER057c/UK114 family) [Sinorhizobium terangae]MQX17359.1 RidA family protein [Sinorhizobium terangae]
MKSTPIDPATLSNPAAPFSQGMLTSSGATWLHISGQISGEGACEDQAKTVWNQITQVLKEAGMEIRNLVKINQYIVAGTDVSAYTKIRNSFIDGHRPANTLVLVPALAGEGVLLEVEAVAAKF